MTELRLQLQALAGAVATQWRRSLQLRVVASTLVVSLTVVLLVGLLLINSVGEGRLRAKERASVVEASEGIADTQTRIAEASAENPPRPLDATLESIIVNLDERGRPGDLYDVVLLPLSAVRGDQYASPSVDARDVPERLVEAVRRSEAPASTFTTIRRGGEPVDVLVVGGPLVTPAGGYHLYYLFSLASEEESLALVTRTVTFAGVALVVLLGGIAWLVTRQVVRPVRSAARTAERISAGRLDDRMRVRGEDDLAQLARTFNRMAENVQHQIRELEELSRVQRDFVSDVSHELRTPLTTVRLAAEVLHEGRGDYPPEVARAAELLVAEVDRFESLLIDLLEISRFDAGAAVLDTEPTDVAALVRSVVEGESTLAEHRSTPIDLSGVPTEPVPAEIDPRRVQRILRNLIENAIEHGEGRPVEVAVAGDDEAVAVVVRDHGIGLRPGEAGLVFNRFWRADPSRARQTGGTGLGLAISLEDARLHCGWLQAWGAPGLGASFRLTLPRTSGNQVTGSPLSLEPQDAPARETSRA